MISTHTRRRRRALPAHRDNQRGLALAVALFTMALMMLLAASSTTIAMSSIRATRNYRGASQVHLAAESGITEAMQLINGPGVVNLQNDVVAKWGTMWGALPHSFAPLSGFSLTVTPVAFNGDSGRLIATANGVEGVRNTVVANVVRSNIPSSSPGAVYLATDDPTVATFNGNAFTVNGNDRNYTGGAGPAPAVAGISTRNQSNTQQSAAALSDQQKDNVTGLGYLDGPPIIPSVQTSPSAPSMTQLDQIVADLLARPGVVEVIKKNFNGSDSFGTVAAPQITHFGGTDPVVIKGNGSMDGCGIMIVDGDLAIQGSFSFKGLIIVRGATEVKKDPSTQATGNATLYGALWTTNVNLVLGGSAIVQYSSQALTLANQAGGGGALPAPLTVTSLVDCTQLPPNTGGCP